MVLTTEQQAMADALPLQRITTTTVEEEALLLHVRGNRHYGPICRLCICESANARLTTYSRRLEQGVSTLTQTMEEARS